MSPKNMRILSMAAILLLKNDHVCVCVFLHLFACVIDLICGRLWMYETKLQSS